MSYPNFNSNQDMFGTNGFSAIDGNDVPPSFSPGPMGASAAQPISDTTRDPRGLDARNASDSYENPVFRIMERFVAFDKERSVSQDHLNKRIFQELSTVTASQEVIRKQLAEIQALIKSHIRRSEQTQLQGHPQYMHESRPDQLPLSRNAQYGQLGQFDHEATSHPLITDN
ncbi:hypothetical protein GQ44DRAFT_813587 [Phaeosphaeriaceae sp. PMI808]|nr:hypothetical protein GQ44DRAFT_813587 [Phaeosphaeriaceae sp. PMI808]